MPQTVFLIGSGCCADPVAETGAIIGNDFQHGPRRRNFTHDRRIHATIEQELIIFRFLKQRGFLPSMTAPKSSRCSGMGWNADDGAPTVFVETPEEACCTLEDATEAQYHRLAVGNRPDGWPARQQRGSPVRLSPGHCKHPPPTPCN